MCCAAQPHHCTISFTPCIFIPFSCFLPAAPRLSTGAPSFSHLFSCPVSNAHQASILHRTYHTLWCGDPPKNALYNYQVSLRQRKGDLTVRLPEHESASCGPNCLPMFLAAFRLVYSEGQELQNVATFALRDGGPD